MRGPSAAWMPFTRAAAANSTGIMFARPRPISVKPVSTVAEYGSSSAPIIPAQASDALANTSCGAPKRARTASPAKRAMAIPPENAA